MSLMNNKMIALEIVTTDYLYQCIMLSFNKCFQTFLFLTWIILDMINPLAYNVPIVSFKTKVIFHLINLSWKQCSCKTNIAGPRHCCEQT